MSAPSPPRIEDYALISNCETAALIHRNGSMDWLSLPRFDGAACFAALLGEPRHGRWLIAPTQPCESTRRYRDGTLILETQFDTPEGAVQVVDFMGHRGEAWDVVRIVRGLRGRVSMRVELIARFDYGSLAPWVTRLADGRHRFDAGPHSLYLSSETELRGDDGRTIGQFMLAQGEERCFALTWSPSCRAIPQMLDARAALVETESFWRKWASTYEPLGEWPEAVLRSLLTLKGLSHRETGGIVAAGTTSLPERLGSTRNWDYRYCWLRDATFTLYALLVTGFRQEAQAWRRWLQRAVAGSPDLLRTAYGIAGERHLAESEIPWLPGFAASAPVRVGNAASQQVQLDIYGELLDSLYLARQAGLSLDQETWALECGLLNHLEGVWQQPDASIWEARDGPRQFTYSKIMAWVAFDRAIRSAEEGGWHAPLNRWRATRDRIHRLVCERGFNSARQSFVQCLDGSELDGSLLRIALVGFLPISDARVTGTVAAVERHLLRGGLVMRYESEAASDAAPQEGAFLACSFWLVDNYVLQGRKAEARALFERVLSLRNDVGLLAEEYDPDTGRQLGNFPQVFSHIALINCALNLTGAGPAHHRAGVANWPTISQSRD